MLNSADSVTIVVFDPDPMVGQILTQVLSRDRVKVLHTPRADEVLGLVRAKGPDVVLLDCGFRDESGLALAELLSQQDAGLSVILMCASSREVDSPPRGSRWQVLTKPLDLHGVRRAVNCALEGAKHVERRRGIIRIRPTPKNLCARIEECLMPSILAKIGRAVALAVIFGVVAIGLAMVTGFVHPPWLARAEAQAVSPKKEPLGVELVQGKAQTLAVPADVREALGIRKRGVDLLYTAQKPVHGRSLVMPGSTALDPTRLFRVRARFAPSPSSAEVVEIGKIEDRRTTRQLETVFREIRSGDRVGKGDSLAVFHSVDVGNKKNDLIDAIYQLKLDEEILKRAEAKAEAVPEVFLLNARRNVQGDINTINRAVSTLQTWGIPEPDIQAVRDEAEKVIQRQGKHDKDKDALWARVEIRAPVDGVIVERNVSLHEIVVDNTTNLFQIANVDKLTVFANVPEDNLPDLEALESDQRRWTVKTVGSEPIPGFIDDIGYIIDPNQHTAVVKGHIDNKGGKLRGGQFIAATVTLPPVSDVVEVPIAAVVEDGQTSVVFVQTDPKAHSDWFTLRRVELASRLDKSALIRSKLPAKDEQAAEEPQAGLPPLEPLLPGERILQTGVGELKAALLDLESQPKK